VNDHMPNYVVERVIAMLNDVSKSVRGTRIMLVGLAYKPGTGDIREAPSMAIIELMLELGAQLVAVDDHVQEYRWPNGVERVSLNLKSLARVDLAIIVTAHPDVDLAVLEQSEVLVLDTRNTHAVPSAEVL
jgi:UDP-N-acetyl-D-glucosamine dehydrogenase